MNSTYARIPTAGLVALTLGALNYIGCDTQNPVAGNPNLTGACCTDDGCTGVAEENCTGVFFRNESCGDTSPCRGACCTENECVFTRNRNECISLSGEFQGIDTSCNDLGICDPPPSDDTADSEQFGICCVGTNCQEIPLDQCIETVFFEADSCSEVDCTRGACCNSRNEECNEIPRSDCVTSAFNSFAGNGTTCANTNCNLGACCRADGSSCTETDPVACEAGGGVFLGQATDCDHHQCLAVPCCNSDGTCNELLAEACRASGGSVLPSGTSCADAPCSVGLCCALFPSDLPFGDCRDDFTQAGCQSRGATFAGLGLSCDDNTFEPETTVSIIHIANDPPKGSFAAQTKFALNINFSFNPTFPIRVQGSLDPDACPPDASFPIASRNLDFRISSSEAETISLSTQSVTIPDWIQCPGFNTVTEYVEPWRFRILDAHCVASESELLLLRCSQ